MVDNVARNKSFGPDSVSSLSEAADDVGGVFYFIRKLAFGALDDVTLVSSAAGLPVEIVASIGIGGGTEYTEDAAAAADPVGGVLIMVRDDALSAQTTTDGDNIAARGTDKGELYVKHADTMVVDGSAVTQPVSHAALTELAAAIDTEVQVDIVSMPAVDTELTTGDLDTGAGTDTRAVVGLVGSKSGGGEIIPGSATDGLLVNLGANNDVVVSATDLDIRNLTNVDVVTAELSATDNAVLDTIDAVLDAINAKLVTGTVIGDVNLGAVDNAVLDAIAASLAIIDATVFGAGTEAGALRVTLPTDGTGVVKLGAGTAEIGKLAANSGVDIGDVDVLSIAAGTNLIADVGIQPRTTLGFDTFMASGSDGSSILVATKQTIKASAGKLYGWYIYNPEAAVTFVHFYNTDTVTVGTTAPLITLPIPAGAAANVMSDIGITFSAAISCAATTTAGGNTAPATGVSLVALYK